MSFLPTCFPPAVSNTSFVSLCLLTLNFSLSRSLVWKGSKLRFSHLLGHRSHLSDGLGFLAIKMQAVTLQAQLIVQHFSRQTLFLNHLDGPTSLAVGCHPKLKKISCVWHFAFRAWYNLQPHWEDDLSSWTVLEALSFPVSGTLKGEPLECFLGFTYVC